MAEPQEETVQRQPCPWRILDDAGGAFAMGAICGTAWHGVRGYRTGPRGLKFAEAMQAVKIRAPVMAGGFGMWGLSFASFDCSLVYLRGKDDPWNSIASGGLTGGLLAARMGARACAMSALSGAVILAAIEGLSITINRWTTQQQNPVRPTLPDDPLGPLPAPPPPGQQQGAF